ncbi:flagellar hook-length control protein FliK [Enterobacteriaceae bacterium H16N7]|nr:flagellar hook-length control protein FliK [Dryocola clanedunensis]
MKDISLASAGLLQALSETSVQANGSAGEGMPERRTFTLPDMALDAIGHRAHLAKNGADERAAESDQTAQMQMLLSLFLTPGPQPEPQQDRHFSLPNDSAKLLHTLAQMQNRSGSQAAKGAGLLATATPAQESAVKAQTSGEQMNMLPPKLQAALASLIVSDPQTQQATPAQQAQLAQNAAQNLHVIAPERTVRPAAPRMSLRTGDPRLTAHVAMTKPDRTGSERGNLSPILTDTTFLKHSENVVNTASPREVTVALNMQSDDLGEQLTNMLKDRIQFQLNEQQQTSTIRLDPPSLGKMSISIQLDAGRLTVHIDASQADVSRALTQLSDNLRQHLTEQNFVQVNVQVSSDGRSQQESQQQQGNQRGSQQQIVSAAELEGDTDNGKQNDSVLIKV